MTAVQILRLHETHESKEKPLEKKRRVTDKFCLICLLILLFTWLSLWGYAICTKLSSVLSCQYTDQHATIISCENIAQINSSSNALQNLTLLINSTIHLLNNNEVFSDLYTWHAIGIIKSLTVIYFMAKSSLLFIKIARKCKIFGYPAHFIIVYTGKLITILIFTIGLHSNYSFSYNLAYNKLFLLYIPELYTFAYSLSLIMITFSNLRGELNHFTEVLRYYNRFRNLILFRVLIFTMMVLIVALNITLAKNLYSKSMSILLSINFGSMCTIFFLHTYGEIVIMASSAHHDWDEKVISLKDIVLAMFIIGKFHLGTVFFHTLCVRHLFAFQDTENIPERDVIEEHFGKKMDFVSHVVKRSAILTAIHGQDFDEANTNFIWFEIHNEVKFDFESTTSIAWNDISCIYFTNASVLLIMPIENVESFYTEMIIVGITLAVQASYSYIISIMNTIDYTIEFCKVENEKKNETSDLEQSE